MSIAAPMAHAGTKPSQGTSVGLDHDPQGFVTRATTNADGRVTFRDLKPGKYVVVVNGCKGPNGWETFTCDKADGIAGANLTGDLGGWEIVSVSEGGTTFSIAAPLCRDVADGDIRVGFTIPDQPGSDGSVVVRLGISDQAATGNLSSF
jgi:hypothetical protein